ncbi:nucleotidyltransferase AbiEii toxin of type IV toxin-antitoxin system [Tepidimonas ignava]|uniref:Nucleotidyl transferase AbiEii toxin, Type IV TA system n=1 Tax=Tepidimonas ignava TaxID=114249 RepID=A0A4R3LEY8_9BURK|nr:nucleotidyl transferase AbiEii/AbiGii toxin family protein [Tepidimonas ignava]TCS98731.1 nucleotidyltransferase AbiEii toxin of type IV toxin-antitoxin system [Tepidimonas ignava]TSE20342.1 Nucleotidyl transferase AbiEii toxin, Type IV TA system [Tepidimonas ignava]
MADIPREHYFDLSASDQADLLQSLAPVVGRRAEILEKDIWLWQVLDILFQLPCRKPMAFKGGTSLSKVYKAIDRFSEDIDVTVDYRSLVADAPELESMTSNSQRSKLSDEQPAQQVVGSIEGGTHDARHRRVDAGITGSTCHGASHAAHQHRGQR